MITQDQILAIVRHLLTMVGGVLMMHATVDAATWELISGAVIGIAGIAWSIYDKNKKAKEISEAKAAAEEAIKPKKKLLKG